MGNKSGPELTLSFLLITALCLEALIIQKVIYLSSKEMTWTTARQYCQKHAIDLITWNVASKVQVSRWMVSENISQIWIGLHRDPQESSAWRWINIKTGVGVTGNDVSWNSKWADGQHSGHCAVVGDDQMWYSVQCSSEYNVYCLAEEKIIYHEVTLSWYNASQFCQDMGTSLATITKKSKGLSHSGWIGLYQQDGLNWDWIGDLPSDYRNWAPREPLTADCGSFNSVNEKWYSKKCSEKLRLICYSDNLVVVNENKTWEEALRHCRNMKACTSSCTHHYDILSLPYLYEYSYVRDRIYRATTDEVWLGLRFLGGKWWWKNGVKLDHQGMLAECPSQQNRCGTLSKYDTNNWITRDCTERRNFVCYKYKI